MSFTSHLMVTILPFTKCALSLCHAPFQTPHSTPHSSPELIPQASPHSHSPAHLHTPDSMSSPELPKSLPIVSLDTLHIPLLFHGLLGPHLHPLPYHLVSHPTILCSAPRPYAPLSYVSAPHAPHSYAMDMLHHVGLHI